MALCIDIWSDIACPWCYVGKRRLEAALERFDEPVEVVWHAFELDPSAPRVRDPNTTYAERLASKYRTSVPEADAMIRRMTDVAAADGLELHFDRVRSGNTFDAHRTLQLGAERGVQDGVAERLFRAYFTEGEAIGERDVLVRLATDAGLDADETRTMLESDRHSAEVRADEERARALGITGVPFYVIAGRYGVSGAQPPEQILRVLESARTSVNRE